MIKIATVCSGIGSPEQSLKNLNIEHETVFACEIDKYARMTYQANHKANIMYEDITKLDYANLPDHNILIGGFPCQSWSLAGKRQGFNDDKDRGTIFFNILEILKAKRPDVFILENVKGLLSHDQGESFKAILDTLSASINGQFLMFPYFDTLGYDVYYQVLNATDYGIPQNRERVFIIGFKKPVNYKFPEKIKRSNLNLWDLVEPNADSKYFLSDKLLLGFKNKKSNFKASFLTTENRISPCLTARYYKQSALDPYLNIDGKIRRYTPLEFSRLMGFPDNFIKPVSETQQYKQAGNSIVVNVMEAIFKSIFEVWSN